MKENNLDIFKNQLLGYDCLVIYQANNYQNFSLDSLLLGEFTSITKKVKNIIDLCSGNAVIPLYLSLRTSASIYGVEIQEVSHNLGLKSIDENNLEDQITLINDNLIDIHKTLDIDKFDRVTCNPPFFKYKEDSNVNLNDEKTIARHEVLVTFEQIVIEAAKLLKPGGYFSFVHRPDRLTELLSVMRKYKIEPKRVRFVYPKIDKPANHVLVEGKYLGKEDGVIVEKPLIVYNKDNTNTDEINSIYMKNKEG